MKDQILILAPQQDPHALAVAEVINAKAEQTALVWDIERLPLKDRSSFRVSNQGLHLQLGGPFGELTQDMVRSIWIRRPSKFEISNSVGDQKVRDFCHREMDALFKGALAAAEIPQINQYAAEAAARKPLQLKKACDVGLRVPNTLMTNDPNEVRSFWNELEGRCVYKAFTSPFHQVAETRMLFEEDLVHLEMLRHAPIIVQEKIDKGLDIRVNVFGDQVFAASVTTRAPHAELDWRLDLTATWQEHTLPGEICDQLTLLLRKLRLHYGCVDMRQKPDGGYVFFEVNPSGQFLFIELDTGQPLTRALADLLLAPETIQMCD
jgi:glutathione synthase/RimK-type ligase-like ATP-grasp enzyme